MAKAGEGKHELIISNDTMEEKGKFAHHQKNLLIHGPAPQLCASSIVHSNQL